MADGEVPKGPEGTDSHADRPDQADYEVGYGKPPRKNQFQPGRSGNPKGRPKGAKGLKAELREELNELVTVSSDGKSKRIRKRRLILKALAAKAAKGNVAAADRIIALIIQIEGLEDERPGRRPLSETDQLILDQFLGEPEEAAAAEAVPAPEEVTE